MDEEEVFTLYYDILTELIQPKRLITFLIREKLTSISEICTELMKLEKDDPQKAAAYMLSKIESSDDDRKFLKLIAALKCSECYEYLGELLEGPLDIKDSQCLQILIEKFAEDLRYTDPNDLVDDLQRENYLSDQDKRQVLKNERENRHDDEHLCGMLVLINIIAKKKRGWCTALLKAMKVKNSALAKKIIKQIPSNLQDTHTESLPVRSLSTTSERTNVNTIGILSVESSSVSTSRPNPIGRSESPVTTDRGAHNTNLHIDADFAMNSDEEEELLQRAMRASMIDTQNDPSQLGHELSPMEQETTENVSQVRDEFYPMEEDATAETSPKRRLTTDDDGFSSLLSNSENNLPLRHPSQSPIKKQAKLEEANDKPINVVKPIDMTTIMDDDSSNKPVSLDEIREKRLARFASNASNDRHEPVGNSQSDTHLTSHVLQSLNLEEHETVTKKEGNQIPHSSDNNMSPVPSTSTAHSEDYLVSLRQEEADYELAKKLQDEEYRQYGVPNIQNSSVRDMKRDHQLEEKSLNIKPSEASSIRNILKIDDFSDDENSADDIQEVLNLRPYQQELVNYAKERNTLIVAPTGSGKTHVALGISKAHFESMMDDVTDQPKIAFIVPTVALVEQQCKQYRKYLCGNTNKKCIGVSGEAKDSQKMTLGIIVDQYDIFVLTPQILVDALKSEEIRTLGIFTLLIFDECHHTMKDHPYNMVMHIYFQEKFCNQEIPLPQIVGLTASVGVGKADKLESAVTHILTLCANLDSSIKTVQREKISLKEHVNTPTEDIHQVSERHIDPFKVEICDIMCTIEEHLKKVTGTDGVENESDFRKILAIPAERGSERYTQWVNSLKQPVNQMYDHETRRIFVTAIEDLKIYNNALMLNADCRTKDAFEYIEREFAYLNRRCEAPGAKHTDEWLKDIYKEKKPLLERVSHDEVRYKNPKLEKLKKIILEYYRIKPDSRGIIFCKTRDLTLALQNWIISDSEMNFLNPHKLVGSHTSETKGGMTQRKIEDVLEYFRDGKHKLIIATTVAEEGLDISKCNLVIRYEHVTNETARIQAKGRGRAEDAVYILFGQEGRGTIEKDSLNKMREKLMERAIQRINDMSEPEYQDKIKTLQQKARINREMKKLGKEKKKTINPIYQNDNFELRCNKCEAFACMASDVRKIEGSHHIVKDASFRNRAKIKFYPQPIPYKEQTQMGRMFCQECFHEWGTQTEYNSQRFDVIGVKGFLFCESNGRRGTFKRWKDVPFHVPNLTFDEIREMFPSDCNSPDVWNRLQVTLEN